MTDNGGGFRAERAKMVGELKDLIRSSSGMVFMDYRGLDSVGMYELRKAMRPTGVRFRVVKNTLMRLACEEEKPAVPPKAATSATANRCP